MSELRVGIVGTGLIAAKFAAACGLTPGVRAAAVSSRSAEKGRGFAAENGIPLVYEGVTAMAESGEVDLVYVATPHTAHFETCMAALRAGKPVLCEKPLATRKADAEALFCEAEARGLFLMEGMWPRFLPGSLRARQWIEAGRIGNLRFIDAIYSFAVDPANVKPRLVDPALAGGSTFDLGVYTVEMASYYAGADPLAWTGFATPYQPGADATAAVALRYPGDILATLRMGLVCDAPVQMTIQGDKGRIELPRFFLANDALLYEGGALTEQYHEEFALPKGFCWQIAAVRDALAAGWTQHPLVPAAATIATAGVLESLMHSFFPTYY